MSNLSAKSPSRSRPASDGYEKRDASAKAIFSLIAVLVVLGLVMHFCLAGMMERLQKTPPPGDALSGMRRGAEPIALANVPQLQLVPPEDLKRFREREEAELNSYGWMDRTAGVVRIPIARAMDLLLQKGLPVRSRTNEASVGPSKYELQQQRPLSAQPEIQEGK